MPAVFLSFREMAAQPSERKTWFPGVGCTSRSGSNHGRITIFFYLIFFSSCSVKSFLHMAAWWCLLLGAFCIRIIQWLRVPCSDTPGTPQNDFKQPTPRDQIQQQEQQFSNIAVENPATKDIFSFDHRSRSLETSSDKF